MNLEIVAWVSLTIAFLSALVIIVDEVQHPQAMGVMNIVWPVSALYFSVLAVWAYFSLGRKHTRAAMQATMRQNTHAKHGSQPKSEDRDKAEWPTAAQVAIGTSHCGAGCMIADIAVEFSIAAAGLTLLGSMLWAEYICDFFAAWLLGIAFQYFAIKPMRPQLSRGGAVLAAIKADTLSILAFQAGMYAFMALVYFKLFAAPHLTPFDVRYWLMMQIAMICGYATSFPMNAVLIRFGLKEAM